MFPRSLVAAMAAPALLALPIQIPRAEARPSFFIGGGATATSKGFQGGWGISSGVGLPIAPNADFLVRADYHAVPNETGEVLYDRRLDGTSLFGAWPEGVPRASLESVMLGLRLHPSEGRVRVYLDAQVGVGHGPDRKPSRTVYPYYQTAEEHRIEANVALGFGNGIQVRLPAVGSLFADAHYDFFFLEGVPSPVIPVRVGFGLP